MEAVVKELQHDAQLGVFFAQDCNVSTIASEIVGRDSSSVSTTHHDRRQLHRSGSHGFSGEHESSSHSERFIQRIDDAVRKIDRVITDHIGDNHSALLDTVGSVDDLQDHVTSVQSSVHHLKHAVYDLETLMKAQHDKLHSTIQKHRNVDKCSEILRRVLRYNQLSDRVLSSPLSASALTVGGRSRAASMDHNVATSAALRGSGELNSEMVTLALAIREIETLVADPQFEDLTVVRMSLPNIRKIASTMRRDVRVNLRNGMQKLSQADVGDALQILFYLGNLTESVQTTVNDVIQEVERKCGAAIAEDVLVSSTSNSNQTPAAALPNGGGAAEASAQKADVWKAIQDVFGVIRVHALQVWNLQRVLVKMVDPSLNKNYLDLVIEHDEPSLFATFWEVSCAIVRELFFSTLNYRSSVKIVLIASYPRMREEAQRVLNELYAATAHHNHHSDTESFVLDAVAGQTGSRVRKDALQGIAGSEQERNQLLESMAPLYDAFTDRAYRRMANPVHLMFPQSSNFHTSPPGRSDMQTLARTMLSEVDQADHDPVLIDGALQQIQKAVTLFCGNVKRIMNTGKAAIATTSTYGRTPAQAHNVSLLNVLKQLEDALDEIVSRVTAAVDTGASNQKQVGTAFSQKELEALLAKEIAPCRDVIQTLEYSVLGYYLQGLCMLMEGIFAKMHDESFADRSTSERAHNSGSKYMIEFNGAFHVLLEEHIRRLPNAPFVAICVSDFVARLVSVFIRHASLLRPLQENGKLRLANDMAQLELRLEHILPLKTLGAPYEELRAFRHMMFLDNSAILRDSMIDKIRPTNVWHHLISRAPVELQLPHQMKRWNASKYIDWLDRSAGLEGKSSSPSGKSFELTSKSSITKVPLAYPCLKDRKLALSAEKEAWKEIVTCLDAYAQRVSAIADAPISPIYETLQESGPILLAGYEVTVSRDV
ncbi:Conserved oligomeric golgi complex subunit 5, partial [Globisporangium splendens]